MPTPKPQPPLIPPTALNITLATVQELIHQYNNAFIHYFFKLKFNNNKAKYEAAIELIRWRSILPDVVEARKKTKYVETPEEEEEAEAEAELRMKEGADPLGSMLSGDSTIGLNWEEVNELVRFKMHHGQNRPFLPGMVRKNPVSAVQQATMKAHRLLLNDSKNEAQIMSDLEPTRIVLSDGPVTIPGHSLISLKMALDACCQLHGVGPATASLILSAFSPSTIPYFEDELYHWFYNNNADTYNSKGEIDGEVNEQSSETLPSQDSPNPNLKYTPIDKQKFRPKLKYNIEEYDFLVAATAGLRVRLGMDKVGAVDIEKVAFMLVNWEFVSPAGKDRVVRVQMGELEPGSVVLETKVQNDGNDDNVDGVQKVKKDEDEMGEGKKKGDLLDTNADAETSQEKLDHVRKEAKSRRSAGTNTTGATDDSKVKSERQTKSKGKGKRKVDSSIPEERRENDIELKQEESKPMTLRRSKRKKT